LLERQEASPERGTYGRYVGAREETRDDMPLEQTFTIIRVRR
jgi:hypothetical protein